MRIATKTLIVVLVCLIGAGISSSVVFIHYSDLENARYQREVSQLSLREADNVRTITSQWFVTIDLFFYEKQGYLASGIRRQASQLIKILEVIQSYNNSDEKNHFKEVSRAIQVIHSAVDKASTLRSQEGTVWNQYVQLMDEQAGIIIEGIEILYDDYAIVAEARVNAYTASKKRFNFIIWISIGIYLIFVFFSWIWASKNIAKPVEILTQRAKEAKTEEVGLSFLLEKGSKEIMQLSHSFQQFYDKLTIRKQELQDSVDQLTETRLQLVQSEKLASVGQLASGVAHEINNPIGSVASNFNTLKTYAEDLSKILKKQDDCIKTLQDDKLNHKEALKTLNQYKDQKDVTFIIEDLTALLNDSHTGIDRVKKIVSDLLEFSHVNSSNLSEVNINELIDQTIHLIENDRLENITFLKDYQEIPNIVCHGGKIGQALMSVLVNAIDAIQRKGGKGVIQTKTLVKGNKILIEIQDNGSGIEEKNISRIFDPFYTTKDIGDGTGLGLHITQSIIDNHKGHITAISKIDVGTKFRIELPITSSSET